MITYFYRRYYLKYFAKVLMSRALDDMIVGFVNVFFVLILFRKRFVNILFFFVCL